MISPDHVRWIQGYGSVIDLHIGPRHTGDDDLYRPPRTEIAERSKRAGVPVAIEFRGSVWNWTPTGIRRRALA